MFLNDQNRPAGLRYQDGRLTGGTSWDQVHFCRARQMTDVVLTDGAVYDHLALETALKRYDTILVSDAERHLNAEVEPKRDWARHTFRVLEMIDNQVQRCGNAR